MTAYHCPVCLGPAPNPGEDRAPKVLACPVCSTVIVYSRAHGRYIVARGRSQ